MGSSCAGRRISMAADVYPTCYSPAMDRWLARLERRFGRHAPSNLTFWLVALSGVTFAILFVKPAALQLLILDPSAVARGEVWRLITFLFLPWGPTTGPWALFTILALMFLYTIGTSLEAEWGSFRFDVYYFIGVIGTIASALLIGPVTNAYLNLSLLLAFATIFPDYEILLLILPVKVKWLGVLSGGLLAWSFSTGSPNVKAGIAAAILNYLLFFAGPLWERVRGRVSAGARQRRLAGFAPEPARKPRVCAKCGRSEKDDPNLEFRVCDCQEKCHGRLTEYCLEHARAH
jgi:membrane associated rhomboid family serine protease